MRTRALACGRSVAVASACLWSVLAHVTEARAQQPTDAAVAQTLFDEGKRLMQEGKYAQACPKLAESQKLDPGGGTLLALALCHESEGKTASAWGEFNEAASVARKDKRTDREAAANEHIKALDPKLVKLRIVVSSSVAELEIRRDNFVIGSAQWSLPIPVDPGPHTIDASAPGYKKWTTTATVAGEGKVVDVVVPALDTAPKEVAAPAPVPQPAKPVKPPQPEERSGSNQKVWALVAGGAGVIATGVGIGFGISARSKWNDAKKACPASTCQNPSQLQLGKDAGTAADISTVFIIVGAVGIVAGATLFFTAPNDEKRAAQERRVVVSPWVASGAGGIGVGGAL